MAKWFSLFSNTTYFNFARAENVGNMRTKTKQNKMTWERERERDRKVISIN